MRRTSLSSVSLGTSLLGLTGIMSTLVTACAADTSTPRKMEVRKLVTDAGEITTLVPVGAPDTVEKIIGENDLTPVLNNGANIPEKYRPLIDAFGRMSMGCTATHIGKGLVLTAGHCFEAPPTRTNNAKCKDITIEWGVRRDKPAYLISKCLEILAYETNDDRDYAIYRVDKVPPVSIDVDLTKRPSLETKLTIFGFPQLRPLEWSKVCPLKAGQSNAGQAQDWGTDQFAHQCDTEPGNSGSTVLSDDRLVVVGIHDGGVEPWNYGTYLVDTPLREILGKQPTPTPTAQPTAQPTVTPTAQPTATPTPPTGSVPDIVAGPFQNNEEIELASFGKDEASSVSFALETDTEADYDYVLVTSASGFSERSVRVSGKKSRTFRGLKTPVTVTFYSDSAVKSRSVALRNIVLKP